MNSIIISGPPGAGKSTLGKLLSEKFNYEHFTTGKLFKSIGLGTLKNENYYEKFLSLCNERNLSVPSFNTTNDSDAAEIVWNSEFGKSKKFHEVLEEL